MLGGFWSWVGGFAELKIGGSGQERFLNLAMQRGIEIWDSEWVSDDVLRLKAARGDLRELKKIAKACGCDFAYAGGQGLPFVLHYFGGRKGFLAGVVLFGAGLMLLSELIFAVNIVPEEELYALDTERVAALAEELGVKPGAIYRRLDVDGISDKLAKEIPELSWVYIERKGTVVNIKVAERSIYPEELENATVGAIWANRDALVESVLLKHGVAEIGHGDTVEVGDLLVSPMADGRADAIVQARVWYSGYGEGALFEEVLEPVGEKKQVFYVLGENGGSLLLWGQKPTAAENERLCDEDLRQRISFWGQGFTVVKENCYVESVSRREISEEAAKQAAYFGALQVIYARQNPGSRLLNEEVTYQLADGVWQCEVVWECLEDIGSHKREIE